MADSLSDRYSPADVEGKIYDFWMKGGYFKAQDLSTRPPYCIILPPPNVTGSLHLGHALDHTIQDLLIRHKRMCGFNALWMPGTDHAGIATQMVVEKELKKQKQSRQELGREKFVEKVWEWKNQYGNRIVEQMKRLGNSCDWDRLVFTLDEGVSKAVRKVFVELYKKGLIYKGTRLINWSIPLETAISDLEVEYEERRGHIWHLRYPLEDKSGEIIVATTRPETMLGDTAVAVHPDDERYQAWIGKKVVLPLTSRKIPIIADEYVDKEFGSGAVKITPAHDFNDYEVGKRHKLPLINILTTKGLLNKEAGAYQGLKVDEARKKVLEDLKAQGFLVKEEPHTNKVGLCSRSNSVVEPLLSEQWFVRTKSIAEAAKRVVESETITFEPENWTKTYLHWMSIIEDWCISRQLWWGHRIPAWNCKDCSYLTIAEKDPTTCEKCGSSHITQEEDVLDTWFSSALWPFSTMGWPKESETLKTFYPTDVLVTGHDIIFFWVARMIMMGLEFKKDVPFRKVYIHGLVRDAHGKKMSKSLNNSIDPVEMIDQVGADALRFTILAQIATGRDLKFSTQRLEGYRNFMNKIWNASRFSFKALEGFKSPAEGVNAVPEKQYLSVSDQWIISKTAQVEKFVDECFEQFRFSDAANALYSFVWHDFCDWYLEFIKPIIYGADSKERQTTQLVLAQTLNRIMRLLHPFIPFITEEIYQKLPLRGVALVVDTYPTIYNDKAWISLSSDLAALEMDVVREVVTAIRNIRTENRIKPGEKLAVRLAPKDDLAQKILGNNKSAIMTLAKVDPCDIAPAGSLSKCAVTPVRLASLEVDVIVPLEGLVDFDEEIKRIQRLIDKNQKDIAVVSGKLGNESFVKNAPPELVEQDRQLLESLRSQSRSLNESLKRFSS